MCFIQKNIFFSLPAYTTKSANTPLGTVLWTIKTSQEKSINIPQKPQHRKRKVVKICTQMRTGDAYKALRLQLK